MVGTGQSQQTPRSQKQLEAIRDFLDPSRDGYSWRNAHIDMGHLTEILGQIMEVRGCHRTWNEPFSGGLKGTGAGLCHGGWSKETSGL